MARRGRRERGLRAGRSTGAEELGRQTRVGAEAGGLVDAGCSLSRLSWVSGSRTSG